jgi:hypothetical protein
VRRQTVESVKLINQSASHTFEAKPRYDRFLYTSVERYASGYPMWLPASASWTLVGFQNAARRSEGSAGTWTDIEKETRLNFET